MGEIWGGNLPSTTALNTRSAGCVATAHLVRGDLGEIMGRYMGD